MTQDPPILHILCGRIASGKSTLAEKLASADSAVLIGEDAWLADLYGEQMITVQDYMRCSAKLRAAMKPHIVSLLNAGTSVVLDFQANTVVSRSWMRSILDETDAAHKLHFLDVPDDICLERLKARNAGGEHAFAATEEQFRQVTRHFVPPTAQEGFEVVAYKPEHSD